MRSYASGDHSTFKRDDKGNIYKYQKWKENNKNPNKFDAGKRFDGETKDGKPGEPHFNRKTNEDVPTPHVNDPKAPGKVRIPKIDELPNNQRFKPNI